MFRPQELLHLIQDHGKQLTYSSRPASTYTPASGVATRTPTNVTVLGYFYNYQSKDVDGQNVVMGDRKLALPTTDTSGTNIPVPKKGDTFSGEGDVVVVIRVDKIMSGQDAVGYICQVRE